MSQETPQCPQLAAQRFHLDPTLRSDESLEFEEALSQKIVGQGDAIRAVVDLYQVHCADLCPASRPIGNLLLLGPTGSGKTRIVEAAAEILFGDAGGVIKVDCGEFQHSHEIAKLIGSPPGYLGHRETIPLITQEELGKYHTEKIKLSFLLFDEIEKASDALWQLLLGMLDKATLTLGDNGMLDKATLTLGDNRRVDLSQTMIFLTSNLGGREITEMMSDRIGFVNTGRKRDEAADVKMERTAVAAARRKFSPEFMNRLDKVVVFQSLRPSHFEQILEIELVMVQKRIMDTAREKFLFRVTPAARDFLLREGTDLRYGARHLKRAIERHIVYPLANLLSTGQVCLGDMVWVDCDQCERCLLFEKESGGAVLPIATPATMAASAHAAGASSGECAEEPSTATAREAN